MSSVEAGTPVKLAGSKRHSHASPEEKGGSKAPARGEGMSPENKGGGGRNPNLGQARARSREQMDKKKQKLMQKREDGRRSRSLGITGTGTVKRPRDGERSLRTETLERFQHKWIWHARKMLAAEKQSGRPARGGDNPKREQEAGRSDAEGDNPGGCGESDGGGQHGAAHLCHGGGLQVALADAGGRCCGHAGKGQWSNGEGQGGGDGDDDDDCWCCWCWWCCWC